MHFALFNALTLGSKAIQNRNANHLPTRGSFQARPFDEISAHGLQEIEASISERTLFFL